MREILFRGKRKYNGEWVEGYFVYAKSDFDDETLREADIIPHNTDRVYKGEYHLVYPCIPETVGQYTGLTDKNGQKIYEGDIVKYINVFEEVNDPEIGAVVYEQSECCFEIQRTYKNPGNVHIPTSTRATYIIPDKRNLYEIIGNIHDNPELMTGGEE